MAGLESTEMGVISTNVGDIARLRADWDDDHEGSKGVPPSGVLHTRRIIERLVDEPVSDGHDSEALLTALEEEGAEGDDGLFYIPAGTDEEEGTGEEGDAVNGEDVFLYGADDVLMPEEEDDFDDLYDFPPIRRPDRVGRRAA